MIHLTKVGVEFVWNCNFHRLLYMDGPAYMSVDEYNMINIKICE